MVDGVVGGAATRAARAGEPGGDVGAAGMVVGIGKNEKNNKRLGSSACEE
jgi:proteasome assembly chaperone (PAC2) family protein